MSSTLLIAIVSFTWVIYSISLLHYRKVKSARSGTTERMRDLPLFFMFLVGPLFYFLMKRSDRGDRRRFMEGKRRFS